MAAEIIYLIGFMGSGKSTAGRELAAALGCPFTDLDKKIEAYAGKSIAEIFTQDGEDVFRKTESDVLKSLRIKGPAVVSTGGGTPCHGDNMEFMSATGLTIYLKMTARQLAARLVNSKNTRPLIKDVSDSDLTGFIRKKLAGREKWYKRADIIVDGKDLNICHLRTLIEIRSEKK
ncbi:MAG: shikimate kinase [Bacteroidales bacterium]|nr:shikimate kinase [Bacteroidales bacterium]MBN2633144.1 shikimate kinase [Bacteroidales bacterium]